MTEKGKTICIYSPKGGVGKTTVASSIAGVGFLMDKKVLLIDFDLYNGSLCLYVSENINKSILNVSKDIANKTYNNLDKYIYKYNNNIDILCAPKDSRLACAFNINHVKKILDEATKVYDLVVIDTYSILDDLNMEIIKNVDETLFILNNDMANIKNLRNQIRMLKSEDINNYKVLLNSSFDKKSEYFSVYDIKQIIQTNIDYTLSKFSFIKNITSNTFNTEIPLIAKTNVKLYSVTIDRIKLIIKDLIKSDNNG